MTLDDKLKRISKEVRKLAATTADKPIARRNARARVLSALRAVRAHVDAEFPAIVSREGVKRLTIEGRRARLKRQRFVAVRDVTELATFSLAGVPVRTITVPNPQRDGTVIRSTEHYVLRWALVIGPTNPAKLRAAAKSHTERAAALAAHALATG